MIGEIQYTISIETSGYCRDFKVKSYTRLGNFRRALKKIREENRLNYSQLEFQGIRTTNHYICGTDRLAYREYEVMFLD